MMSNWAAFCFVFFFFCLYLPFGFRLYSSFPERNHKRDMSFSEVTTVASFAPSSAIHLNSLGPGSNGELFHSTFLIICVLVDVERNETETNSTC